MLKAEIGAPHPDIELGVRRRALEYLACAPDAGIDRDTGLALFVAGYGMEPCGSYAQSLLGHLANRYNCIAASVNYFGADLEPKARMVPMPDFFTKLAEQYGLTVSAPRGVDVTELLRHVLSLLAANGIRVLNPACRIALVAEEYNSMGFLPALDHLQVAHRLMTEHALNRQRIFAIGTSYGGYVASLMAKIAPDTFRMVVDNSGFASAEDDILGVMGMMGTSLGDLAMTVQTVHCWSPDPAAANYFAKPRREIRSLSEPRHHQPNTTRIYAYHAAGDTVAPTASKLRLREAYAGRVAYDLRIIDETGIDGRVFKTLAHGMDASMRGLFELSYEKYLADGGALADHSDFDLERRRVFPCSGEDYVLRYARRDGVRATLVPSTLSESRARPDQGGAAPFDIVVPAKTGT
jgi:pimeloyl-ACP methyl ester carboxylesterase